MQPKLNNKATTTIIDFLNLITKMNYMDKRLLFSAMLVAMIGTNNAQASMPKVTPPYL